MSREIKFRAWKKENSPEMIHTVSSIDWANKEISFRYRLNSWTFRDDKESLDNIILMQYTGLKDKNGVEIYEGDVVNCTRGCPHEIVWLQEYGGTYVGGMPAWYLSGIKEGYAWTGSEEVIGNIYENPELLEVSK